MENSAPRGNEKRSNTAMLVRTSFRFVMERLFFGNDKVLLGVEVDDDQVLWYSGTQGAASSNARRLAARVRPVPGLKQRVARRDLSLARRIFVSPRK
jgi:hypothetical protein